jgi:hypothetical protein
LETKPQAYLILFASTESEPGNDDASNVCPLASELPILPQSSLWNYCVKNWSAGGFISHDLLVVCKPWFYFVRHNVVYLIVERGDNRQRALERRLAEKLVAVRSSEGTYWMPLTKFESSMQRTMQFVNSWGFISMWFPEGQNQLECFMYLQQPWLDR